MNKLIFVIVSIALCGCQQERPANYYGGGVCVKEIEGHRYITSSRGAIYHAESCWCKHAKDADSFVLEKRQEKQEGGRFPEAGR